MLVGSTPPAKRIACIGTSITDGYVLPESQAYPTQLRTYFNAPDNVLNYGVGGTTLLKKGDNSYWNAEKYTFALQWKPTVVIIEFGTNDSKKQNWVHKSEFKADYLALINTFRQLASSPKIYLCLPPPAFNQNFDIDPEVLRNEVTPLIREVAAENNLPLIDLYTPLAGSPSLFVDGIHPNAQGAVIIADVVYKAITTP